MLTEGRATSTTRIGPSYRSVAGTPGSQYFLQVVLLLAACFEMITAVSYCADKNLFIKNLIAKGVTVFSTPVSATSTTCFKEWSPHKTCCSASSLVAYSAAETQQMNSAITDVSSELMTLGNALTNFLTPVSSVWSSLNTSTVNKTFQTDLGKLRAFTNSLVMSAAIDQLSQTQCSSRIEYLKGQSLCAACSGRSETLFSSQKIRITLQDCKKTVSTCSYAWNRLVALVDHMVVAESIVKTLKYLFPSFLHTIDMNKVAPLEAWIEANQVRSSIQNCANATAPSCDLTSTKKLCENFISLQKKSFSQAALKLVAEELPSLNSVKTKTLTIKYAIDSEPATLDQANNLAVSAGTQLYVSPPIAMTDYTVAQQTATLSGAQLASISLSPGTLQPPSTQNLWNLARRRLQFNCCSGCESSSTNMTNADGMGGDTQCDNADKPEDCQGCMPTDNQFP